MARPPTPPPPVSRRRRLFDWKVLVISRKALYTWIGVLFALLLLAGFLAYYLRGFSMEERARQAIVSAEKAISKAVSAGAEVFAYDKFSQASRELTRAKKSFEGGDFKTAYDYAVRAESLARRMEVELVNQNLATARFATISALSGKVEIKRPKDLSWQPASPGMKLSSDDQIRTFSSSHLQITFDDANILRVKPDSLIVMGNLSEDIVTRTKKSSIRLMTSDIEAKIKRSSAKASEFKIETPTAVARVERADLAVKVTPEKDSRIRVFSGAADVTSGGKLVRVGNNQEVTVTKESQIISASAPLVAAPVLFSPINMKQLTFPNPQQGKVALAWGESSGAKAYHLEIAQDQFFFDPILDLKPLATVLYEVEKLEGGIYFWRVSSLNAQGSEGDFSEPEIFQLKYAAEGIPFKIDSLLVLRGPSGNTLYIQGTTEQFASVSINKTSTTTDEEGRFRVTFKGLPEGTFVVDILVQGEKGHSASFQKEIPVGI
jgi:FecR protein